MELHLTKTHNPFKEQLNSSFLCLGSPEWMVAEMDGIWIGVLKATKAERVVQTVEDVCM